MKKLVSALIVFGLILSVTAAGADVVTDTVAASDEIASGPLKKLGRGIANMGTCPLELLKGMEAAKQENGWFAAVTWGILQGTFNTAKRLVVGAYEVITFPIPLPEDYKPILTDPEFMWDEDFAGKY
jgi:putative exosortase-associated protein (TIGR04073 family)